MSDLPSALGIEAVECVSEGGRSMTVRVTGRWRRRRPEVRGQAMLVVETDAGRQRFPAMPEPPSLMGAAPGTWRMSFTVPIELAAQLAGNSFLQMGAVMVPLSIGEVGEAPGAVVPAPGPEVLEARQLRSSELAAESARLRAAEAEAAVVELVARVGEVEQELARARAESDRLISVIAERERGLRLSEQHTHAERALRAEVEQQLRRRERAAEQERRLLHNRVGDLERELARMRRTVDEAQHLVAAAEARVAQAPGSGPAPVPPTSPPARVATPAPLATPPPVVEPARPARLARRARATVIAAELALSRMRPAAGTAPWRPEPATVVLEHELANARRDLERQRLICERAYDAIDQVRGELARLGGEAPPPPPGRAPAPSAPVQAERLSAALARLRADTPPDKTLDREPTAPEPTALAPTALAPTALAPTALAPTALAPTALAPTALAPTALAPTALAPTALAPTALAPTALAPTALAPTAPEPTAPEPPVPTDRPARPWLAKAFRTLSARDASSAGRLLLALLPAQRAADPRPVAYDLVLGDLATARVTVSSASTQIDLGDTPRPMAEVDFRLTGDLAGTARLLIAGGLERLIARCLRLGRLARIDGDRGRLAALENLIAAPLSLRQLVAAGVRLDPVLSLTVAALMIEPEWTAGERFTIAHREPRAPTPGAYLHILGGRPPLAAAEPPHGPVATVIVCAADELPAVLAAEPSASFSIEGEQRPLALVRRWLDRAQSG